jgi:diketogulonate reductase-like aldo/keto reductase
MHIVTLPSGETVPAYGMGTWHMGDDPGARAEELATLRLGLDLGATLIDTAEMYGDGRAEELVGAAIVGRRDDAFIVSKVYPHNATHAGAIAACERSLRRLGTDRIDLYLLHWRGSVPLAETVGAFVKLQREGKIRHYGVSNLDLTDMEELWHAPGGDRAQTDQVLYNLTRRGIEWDLLPRLRTRHLPVMAYSPIEQARLLAHTGLRKFARSQNLTPAQVALAWLLRDKNVIAIPKTGTRAKLKENIAACDVKLDAPQLAALDAMFPPPSAPQPLDML